MNHHISDYYPNIFEELEKCLKENPNVIADSIDMQNKFLYEKSDLECFKKFHERWG